MIHIEQNYFQIYVSPSTDMRFSFMFCETNLTTYALFEKILERNPTDEEGDIDRHSFFNITTCIRIRVVASRDPQNVLRTKLGMQKFHKCGWPNSWRSESCTEVRTC